MFYFLRTFLTSHGVSDNVQDLNGKPEHPDWRHTAEFTHFTHEQNMDDISLKLAFRTRQAPRSADAKNHHQTFKLASYRYERQLHVHMVGKGDLSLGTFTYEGEGQQAQFGINHSDGTGHCFFIYPPDKEFAEKPAKRKTSKQEVNKDAE